MREPQKPPTRPERPEAAEPLVVAQSRALERRHNLDEQQRTFLKSYPVHHLIRRRPPG